VLESFPGAQPRPCSLDPPPAANSSKVNLRDSNLDHQVLPETVWRLIGSRLELSDTRTGSNSVRPHFPDFRDHPSFEVSATPRVTRTHAPTVGNSTSSGLRSGSAHGLRDVRTTDPEAEVERPPASPEPNTKSKETNRKTHEQLPVPSKPYNI